MPLDRVINCITRNFGQNELRTLGNSIRLLITDSDNHSKTLNKIRDTIQLCYRTYFDDGIVSKKRDSDKIALEKSFWDVFLVNKVENKSYLLRNKASYRVEKNKILFLDPLDYKSKAKVLEELKKLTVIPPQNNRESPVYTLIKRLLINNVKPIYENTFEQDKIESRLECIQLLRRNDTVGIVQKKTRLNNNNRELKKEIERLNKVAWARNFDDHFQRYNPWADRSILKEAGNVLSDAYNHSKPTVKDYESVDRLTKTSETIGGLFGFAVGVIAPFLARKIPVLAELPVQSPAKASEAGRLLGTGFGTATGYTYLASKTVLGVTIGFIGATGTMLLGGADYCLNGSICKEFVYSNGKAAKIKCEFENGQLFFVKNKNEIMQKYDIEYIANGFVATAKNGMGYNIVLSLVYKTERGKHAEARVQAYIRRDKHDATVFMMGYKRKKVEDNKSLINRLSGSTVSQATLRRQEAKLKSRMQRCKSDLAAYLTNHFSSDANLTKKMIATLAENFFQENDPDRSLLKGCLVKGI